MTDPWRSLTSVVSRLRTISTRVLARWIQWWWTDGLIAGGLALILGCSSRPGTGVDLLGALKLPARLAAYDNMLQLTVIFAGFSGVGFTIYLGLSSRAVQQIKTRAGKALLRVWMAAIVIPWVCALMLVLCGITDRGGLETHNLTRWIAVAAINLVILQMARIVWIFYQLAAIELDGGAAASPRTSSEEVRVIRRAL